MIIQHKYCSLTKKGTEWYSSFVRYIVFRPEKKNRPSVLLKRKHISPKRMILPWKDGSLIRLQGLKCDWPPCLKEAEWRLQKVAHALSPARPCPRRPAQHVLRDFRCWWGGMGRAREEEAGGYSLLCGKTQFSHLTQTSKHFKGRKKKKKWTQDTLLSIMWKMDVSQFFLCLFVFANNAFNSHGAT